MRWVSILSAGLESLGANNVSECACASVSNAIQYEYQQRKVEKVTNSNSTFEYRGYRIQKISKRNSNLKWRVRFPGSENPYRFRTKTEVIEFVDLFEDRKKTTAQK